MFSGIRGKFLGREGCGANRPPAKIAIKRLAYLGIAGSGGNGGCAIFNTNPDEPGSCLANGDLDLNVWNRGVYTAP